MIKLIKTVTVVCLTALILSCSKDEAKEVKAEITVEQTQISLSGEKNSRSVGVTASGAWDCANGCAWCKAAKAGDAVLITVEKNDRSASRSATVTLQCSTAQATISVLQNALASKVAFSQNEIIVDATQLETSVNLSADTKWEITIPEGDDWIHAAPTQGEGNATVVISMTQNELAKLRERHPYTLLH